MPWFNKDTYPVIIVAMSTLPPKNNDKRYVLDWLMQIGTEQHARNDALWIIIFFLRRATQRIVQPARPNALQQSSELLKSCQRGHTNAGATARGSATGSMC